MTHDEAQELLGAYALDAVPEEESALVAAHVAECPRCTVELAELHEVAAMLGNAGGDAPRELWDRIASQATRPPGAPLRTPDLGVALAPRRHRARRRGPLLAGAAVALAAAVTIVLLAGQVATLNNRVNSLDRISQGQGIMAAEQAAMGAPGTRLVGLSAVAGSTRVATIVLVRGDGPSFFVNTGLAALPRSRTYQLWGVAGGTAVSLGLLGARPGVVPFVVNARRPRTTFAVTVERAVGAAQPTSTPVAASPATA